MKKQKIAKKVVAMFALLVFCVTMLPTVTFAAQDEWVDGVRYYGTLLVEVDPERNADTLYVREGTEIIDYGVFDFAKPISNIYLPSSIKSIFSSPWGVKNVWYDGSEEEKENIEVYWVADDILEATWRYNCGVSGECTWRVEDGTLTVSGNGNMAERGKPWYGWDITAAAVEEGVTSIGENAFAFTNNLQSVQLPNTLRSIGDFAFNGCKSLTEIVIPDSVQSVGIYAFSGCKALESVQLSKGMTEIKGMAFFDCGALKSITIPGNIKTVGVQAFEGCNLLADVHLFEGVTTIDDYAFDGCGSLASVTIPLSVTSIGDGVFSKWANFEVYYAGDENDRNSIEIGQRNDALTSATWHYLSDGKPDVQSGVTGDCTWEVIDGVLYINGNGVMGDYSVENPAPWGTEITDIVFGEGVTGIGFDAFDHCSNLTSLTVPEGITHIEYGAFADCENLTSLTILSKDAYIGPYAFCECRNLSDITLPDDVKYIGYYAFGATAYSGNDENWNGSVLYIDNYLVQTRFIYADYQVKSGTKIIADSAFRERDLVTSVALPAGLKHVNAGAFYRCINLAAITIPNTVETIGDYAFDGCVDLQTVYYTGSEEEWNAIDIGEGNEYLKNANIIFNVSALGDVNGDTKIDSTDARLVLQYFVGSVEEQELNLDNADVNGDTKVDSTDARLILQYFVGSITEFPAA